MNTAQKVAVNYYRAKLNLLHSLSARLAAREAFKLFTRPYGGARKRKMKLWQQAESLRLISGKLQLQGYRWRAADANEKRLLIVHGFGGSIASFERYIKPLLAMGYDVYAYDAPAHGRSKGRRLNVVTYGGMLENVIHTHGPFHAYLAHSLGGLALMLTLSKISYSKDLRIVLIAPATESTTAADKFFDFLQLPDTLRQAFDEYIEKVGGKPLSWYSISRVADHIQAQILWLHDYNDNTTPIADVLPLQDRGLPHIQFYFTRGLGHSGIYKDNKVKKKILSFLQTGSPV